VTALYHWLMFLAYAVPCCMAMGVGFRLAIEQTARDNARDRDGGAR
jgi:hypothetical protein